MTRGGSRADRWERAAIAFRVPLLGVRLVFNFWFFAVVALFAALDHALLLRYIALPILIHEGGHLLVLAACRVPVAAVVFTPVSLGIQLRPGRAVSYRKDLAIALGGIAANLLAAFLLHRFAFHSMRTMLMVAANVAVALFNLLPVGDLDGGQVVKTICARFFTPRAARTISRAVSFLVLTPLFAAAIFLLLRDSGNFTLLVCCVYLALTVIFRD